MWLKVKSWLVQTKWVLWALLGVVVVFLFAMVAPFFKRKTRGPGGGVTSEDILPALPAIVQAKLDEVHEEAATARAEATVRSEDQRKELAEIRQIDDDRERRARLAAHLRSL